MQPFYMIIFLLKQGFISIAGGKKGPNTNPKHDYLLLQRKLEPEKFMEKSGPNLK